VLAELDWVMERAVEHYGPDRAARNLRKFYPWYLDRLGPGATVADALQRAPTVAAARDILAALGAPAAA
jgi:tRNA-dihydrouridine synthase B